MDVWDHAEGRLEEYYWVQRVFKIQATYLGSWGKVWGALDMFSVWTLLIGLGSE